MYKLTAALVALTVHAGAASADLSRPFETRDEARQRHSAENYQTFERNRYQAPLGGYNERLGDPAPRGTERPGYTPPQRYDSAPPFGTFDQQRRPQERRWP